MNSMTTSPPVTSMKLSRMPWTCPPASVALSGHWPSLTAETLRTVREPLRWCLVPGSRAPLESVVERLRWGIRGPVDDNWSPPGWLRPHQIDAARRVAGCLSCLGGALLADAVGLGKTYVALSLAT